jgi:hypothetical protein
MFSRHDFMQGQLLKNITDPEVHNGVCAALCDFWLRAIRQRFGPTRLTLLPLA